MFQIGFSIAFLSSSFCQFKMLSTVLHILGPFHSTSMIMGEQELTIK